MAIVTGSFIDTVRTGEGLTLGGGSPTSLFTQNNETTISFSDKRPIYRGRTVDGYVYSVGTAPVDAIDVVIIGYT